ncbi:acyl-homoserine-lactone synthase [Caldimonas brevitalea]|uniref:Acyl-homoserine-lactone synthase n=1 Tax=Caldimonas brevitalea TaxID=413882 RepID=A0A0G3BC05_9BURK|nr:acyl-homoserine-lactone synthase [Caldimonas brevitalea]AKJ26889.1 autoinducer synthesis protein LuxI [Caldimonas brevitalea]
MQEISFEHRIAKRSQLPAADVDAMLRLRARVFHQRLGWDVDVRNGREEDWYDAVDPYYLLMKGGDRQLYGCMRLLPTLGPNMLRDVFPTLLGGRPAPADPFTWEISRFATEFPAPSADAACKQRQQTLRYEAIRAAMRRLIDFADAHGIERYVMVTTPVVQRMLDQLQVPATCYAAPVRFGVDEAVALSVQVGEATRRVLGWSPYHNVPALGSACAAATDVVPCL